MAPVPLNTWALAVSNKDVAVPKSSAPKTAPLAPTTPLISQLVVSTNEALTVPVTVVTACA